MTARCKFCQYHREPMMLWPDGKWCSNTQSSLFRLYTTVTDTCNMFVKRGKKAPARVRIGIKIVRKIRERIKNATD